MGYGWRQCNRRGYRGGTGEVRRERNRGSSGDGWRIARGGGRFQRSLVKPEQHNPQGIARDGDQDEQSK